MRRLITRKLQSRGNLTVAIWALSFAFTSYFCMYAFRKPFTAGTYHDVAGWTSGMDFKSAAVISQVLGYAVSKYLGVKFVSEAKEKGRTSLILGLILFAEAALVLFAVAPAPVKLVAIFLNGLPLGMIFGLVFRYLEGRRTSEFLGAGLCTSFIVSSGFVKSIGRSLMDQFGVTEFWMPAATGLVFLPVIALAVWLLSMTPAPDDLDIVERAVRQPMDAQARAHFFRQYAPGLALLGLSFIALGALRDFRDNFAADIWKALGYGNAPELFTLAELPAAALVLVSLSLMILVHDNRRAVWRIHLLMASGVLLALGATFGFQLHILSPVAWMVIMGAGVYLGYVPCTSILADRLIAALKSGGNSGFMMYVLDAFAYGGSVGVLLVRSLATADLSWLHFFIGFAYVALAIALLATLASMIYFDKSARLDATASSALIQMDEVVDA